MLELRGALPDYMMNSLHSGISVEDLKRLTEMRLNGQPIECDLQLSPEEALQIVRSKRQEKELRGEDFSDYAYVAADGGGCYTVPTRGLSNSPPAYTVPVSTSGGLILNHHSIPIVSSPKYEIPYGHVYSGYSPLTPCNSIPWP